MQSQVVNVMVPEWLLPQKGKAILHVFIWEILINTTQVSNVAPEPLMCFLSPRQGSGRENTPFVGYKSY
jgi:hypothetical protein